jgi:glycosyltransferase involved in cell wall biosynthesis
MLKKRPDYVITSSSTSMFGWLTKLFPHPLKPKVILDIRSTPIRVKGTFREYLHTIMFRVSVVLAKKKFDGMTTLTQLMKKAICYNFDINPNFVGVWTSGVSTEFFVLNKYDAKQLRRELGLENKFIVFYHGALSKARGIGETIKSVKILKTRHDDIVLFLLGTGTGVQELMKIAEETGVQDKVIVHGWVNYSEVPKYIAMCDVAIVPLPDSPNWRYQCPLKLLEYLAMNKVAIVTDIPANRAIVGKCKCGIVVPSANPQEIAKAIEYAYVNRKKLNEWGGCGRALVEKSYSWEKIAKDFENYLLSL